MKRAGMVLGCAAIAAAALGMGCVIWVYREEILSALGALAILIAIGLFVAWKDREDRKTAEALQRRDAEGVLVIERTTVTVTRHERKG